MKAIDEAESIIRSAWAQRESRAQALDTLCFLAGSAGVALYLSGRRREARDLFTFLSIGATGVAWDRLSGGTLRASWAVRHGILPGLAALCHATQKGAKNG